MEFDLAEFGLGRGKLVGGAFEVGGLGLGDVFRRLFQIGGVVEVQQFEALIFLQWRGIAVILGRLYPVGAVGSTEGIDLFLRHT